MTQMRSRVKHSTTESLRSHVGSFYISCVSIETNFIIFVLLLTTSESRTKIRVVLGSLCQILRLGKRAESGGS